MFSDFSMASLIPGFVFGVFGFALFRYGKKEGNFKKLIIGLVLMVYPYFFSNLWVLWILGVVLTVLGYRS